MLLIKRISFGFIIALFTFLSGTSAWGHAELQSSSPEKGDVVVLIPNKISLTFNEDLLILGKEPINTLALRDFYDEDVSLYDVKIEGNSISAMVNLSSPVLSGEFRIVYRVVSADGHPVEGEIPFIYAPEEESSVDEKAVPVGEDAGTPSSSEGSMGFNSLLIVGSIILILIICALLLVRKRK